MPVLAKEALFTIDYELTEAQKRLVLEFVEKASDYPRMIIARDLASTRFDILLDSLTLVRRKPLPFARDHPELAASMLELGREVVKNLREKITRMRGLRRKRVYLSVMVVEPGTRRQGEHVDRGEDGGYWTVSVPVTMHKKQGDTEFANWVPPAGVTKGWNGTTLHQGGPNRSRRDRVFLMAVFCDGDDLNRSKSWLPTAPIFAPP